MRKTAFALIAAVVILSGCATLSDTTDRACDSVVLNWLCGDAEKISGKIKKNPAVSGFSFSIGNKNIRDCRGPSPAPGVGIFVLYRLRSWVDFQK